MASILGTALSSAFGAGAAAARTAAQKKKTPAATRAYSYDDFQKAANAAGLMGQFSKADLERARQYPEFGMSILNYKKDYNSAATDEARYLANARANALRNSYGNYSGGTTGAGYYSAGKIPGQIDGVLDQISGYGSFAQTANAPTYENRYAQQQKELLDAIINREGFSWNKDEDPSYAAYKKEYLREGDRATANALAQVSAASGGRPSSYAVNAATQAGDYYATKLSDAVPTLYQQAYDRYLQEYQMKQQDLSAVNSQEQMDYAKYLDQLSQYNTDRNFEYQKYLGGLDVLQGKLSALQGQDAVDYGRYLDDYNQKLQAEQQAYERSQAQQALSQAQVDAMLGVGARPSAELVSGSGYSSEYINALQKAYQDKLAAAAAKGSSGSSGSAGGGMDFAGLFQAAKASGNPASFLKQRSNYKKYGFDSAPSYADYEAWAEGAGSGEDGMNSSYFRQMATTISTQLQQGRADQVISGLENAWGRMSKAQKQQIQSMLEGYGYQYAED